MLVGPPAPKAALLSAGAVSMEAAGIWDRQTRPPYLRCRASGEGNPPVEPISPPIFPEHPSRRADGPELPEQDERATNATRHAQRSGIRSNRR